MSHQVGDAGKQCVREWESTALSWSFYPQFQSLEILTEAFSLVVFDVRLLHEITDLNFVHRNVVFSYYVHRFNED